MCVWLMFEQLNFKKREGKRGKNLAGPKGEKREKTKLPSVNSASDIIIISEFLTRELPHYHYSKGKTRLRNQKTALEAGGGRREVSCK